MNLWVHLVKTPFYSCTQKRNNSSRRIGTTEFGTLHHITDSVVVKNHLAGSNMNLLLDVKTSAVGSMSRPLFCLVSARHKVTPALFLLTQSRYWGQLLWRSPHK